MERIDVYDGYWGQGYGTQLLRAIADEMGAYDIASDNEDAARLYARIGCEMSRTDYDAYGWAIDQGYGVYTIG